MVVRVLRVMIDTAFRRMDSALASLEKATLQLMPLDQGAEVLKRMRQGKV